MDIDSKKIFLDEKLQQLRNSENEQKDILNDIKFLVDFEDCFDELKNNANACYIYEQMLKTVEDYIRETDNQEEKSFLQYSILVPSILRMETAYLNSNFEMGIIGIKLCENYLKITEPNIMKVYLNELVYALENRDAAYAKEIKKGLQSEETNFDILKEYVWNIYDKENKNLAIEIVKSIYVNGDFDELAKRILLEFEDRERKEILNKQKASNKKEKIVNVDEEIMEQDDLALDEETDEKNSKNLEQKLDEEKNTKNSDIEKMKKSKKTKIQIEAEFSKKHGEELKDLILAMLNKDNKRVQNLIEVFKEFPIASNLYNRIFNLYNRNPKVAAKILVELYNKGNGELHIDSSQLNSAKTATLEQRESSIDEVRGRVHSRSQQMQVTLSSIRENLTQPRLSKSIVQENIELLKAKYKKASSTISSKEELEGIKELLDYANLILQQMKEMENILSEDE